ncbi:hypothetical protein BGI08_05790 [Snodgrassella alvi]|nr:hypothetical protein BGI08_05790 [Snodgrassella alvi]
MSTHLNNDLPVGVEGDFASTNPYYSVLAGEGQIKAGDQGVIVGSFAWFDPETGLATNTKVANGLIGFVRRDNTALLNEYLAESSLTIPKGFIVTLYDGGDFWARFAGGANIGQKVFASTANGSVAAADTAPAGYEETGFIVASKAEAGALAKISKH